MENTTNYEETREILEDNIIRLMMEKNLTARALSIRIEKNEWYITRMLNGNKVQKVTVQGNVMADKNPG